ncbi:MAG: hypothetical protein K5765_06670 [Clostridia bacterium]|nr:hypothetical protein [Clostridia bacterium]
MNEQINNIIDHIRKAHEEALKKGIETNAIIIDRDIAYCNNLYIDNCVINPMILGLKISYSATPLPLNSNFILFHQENWVDTTQSKLQAFHLIKEKNVDISVLKKYDYVTHYNFYRRSGSKRLNKSEFKLLKNIL